MKSSCLLFLILSCVSIMPYLCASHLESDGLGGISVSLLSERRKSFLERVTAAFDKQGKNYVLEVIREELDISSSSDSHELFLQSKPVRFGRDVQPGDFLFISHPTRDDLDIHEGWIYFGDNCFISLISGQAVSSTDQLLGSSVFSLDHSQRLRSGPNEGAFIFWGSFFDAPVREISSALTAASYVPEKLTCSVEDGYAYKDDDLVEITSVNKHIRYEMLYASPHNFVGEVIYAQPACYGRYAVCRKLDAVQQELEKQGLGLKITDFYRPRSAQKILFDACPVPWLVADPKYGSKHNRGAAVDLTIIRLEGEKELDMGSPIDEMSERSYGSFDLYLTQEQKDNRRLLRDIMIRHGFNSIDSEWWHFDDSDYEKYPLEDVSFDDLAKQERIKI